MLDVNALKAQDLQGLSQSAMVELATEMLAQITAMNALLQARDKQAAEHAQGRIGSFPGRFIHQLAAFGCGVQVTHDARVVAGLRIVNPD